MQRQINMKKVTNKKGIRRTSFFLHQFHKLVFERGYGERRQKEKGNKCDRNEKTRREKKTTDEQIHEQMVIQR